MVGSSDLLIFFGITITIEAGIYRLPFVQMDGGSPLDSPDNSVTVHILLT